MSSTDLVFRLAEPADAAALGDFMSRNFLAAYGHCSTPANVQRAILDYYGEPAQRRQIDDPARWNLIVQQGPHWVGHAQLNFGGSLPAGAPVGAVELGRFYVDTTAHGRGVAQAMMARVRAEARARGGRGLWLSVWQEAPQAIRFYEKEGFRKAGSLVFVVGDDPKDDWLMVSDLD